MTSVPPSRRYDVLVSVDYCINRSVSLLSNTMLCYQRSAASSTHLAHHGVTGLVELDCCQSGLCSQCHLPKDFVYVGVVLPYLGQWSKVVAVQDGEIFCVKGCPLPRDETHVMLLNLATGRMCLLPDGHRPRRGGRARDEFIPDLCLRRGSGCAVPDTLGKFQLGLIAVWWCSREADQGPVETKPIASDEACLSESCGPATLSTTSERTTARESAHGNRRFHERQRINCYS